MKKKGSILAAIGLTFALATSVFAATPFTDIDSSYAKDEITALQEYEIIEGYGDGTFKPEGKITRQEFAKIMCLGMSLEENAEAAATFTDVSDWAKGYVGALAELGIIEGYNETEFGGTDEITREDMVTIIVRSLASEEIAAFAYEEGDIVGDFADEGAISDYAKANVAFAKAIGLVKGDGTNFFPDAKAERQAVARLVYELLENLDVYLEKIEEIVLNLNEEHVAALEEMFGDGEEIIIES